MNHSLSDKIRGLVAVDLEFLKSASILVSLRDSIVKAWASVRPLCRGYVEVLQEYKGGGFNDQ